MTSEKRLGRTAGSLYVIVAVLGGFAQLSVRPRGGIDITLNVARRSRDSPMAMSAT